MLKTTISPKTYNYFLKLTVWAYLNSTKNVILVRGECPKRYPADP